MKTKKIIILTLAAVLATGGFTILNLRAQDVPQQQGALHGRFLQRIKEKLDLTSDQTVQIKAVLKADKENLTALMTRMHQARVDLRESIRAANASEANVRAASARVAGVEADLAVERMKLFAKISPILTDEQRARLAEMEERADNFMDHAIARAGEQLAD